MQSTRDRHQQHQADIFIETRQFGEGDQLCFSEVRAHWVEQLGVLVVDAHYETTVNLDPELRQALSVECPAKRYLESFETAAQAVRRTVEWADAWHAKVEQVVNRSLPRGER